MSELPENRENNMAAVVPADFIPAQDPTHPPGDGEPQTSPGMNWFVLRVASNKESSVQRTLIRKIKIENFQHLINRVLVPTEKIKEIKTDKNGKSKPKIIESKLYPGYVFVEMRLEKDGRIPQDIFFLVKETSGVGDFIGTAGRPTAMRPEEVEKMLIASRPPEAQPEVRMEFQVGDHVKIAGGPFEGMEGTIDSVDAVHGKVRVIVTIFGRATSVDMDYLLVQKYEDGQ